MSDCLNGTYLITNKTYSKANIAQWGTGDRDMGTNETELHRNQFWCLELVYPSYYIITNCYYEGYCIGKWGPKNEDVGLWYEGDTNKLWKFVEEGNGYYRIYNYKYPNAKIAKWGKGDGDWGTFEGENRDDQLWELKVQKPSPLDGNTFLITNKTYTHAKIAQWGIGARDMGTFEKKVDLDQFWWLEESQVYPDYYFIHNLRNEGYRIGKYGNGNKDVGIVNNYFKYYNSQLWKFVKAGNGYFRIFNKEYPKAKIAKWGKEDGDWGTWEGDDYDDQLWKLTPRYEASVSQEIIWEHDNRACAAPFSSTTKVMKGIRLTNSPSLSTKVRLEGSLNYAASKMVRVLIISS